MYMLFVDTNGGQYSSELVQDKFADTKGLIRYCKS